MYARVVCQPSSAGRLAASATTSYNDLVSYLPVPPNPRAAEKRMTRPFVTKLAILVGAVATAFILTVYRPSPQGLIPFGVGQAEVRAAPGTPPAKAKGNYDLAALKVFNQTLVRIRDNYVDPTRVDA